MNKLQPLGADQQYFVTLNPARPIADGQEFYRATYMHPIFDRPALEAQKALPEISGADRIFYAGAHFGYGFHEDGLQSGLFAAECMGSDARPWFIPGMYDRIIGLTDTSFMPADHLIYSKAAE